MLVYYLAELPEFGGPQVSGPLAGILTAAYFAAELVLSPVFGILSDRFGARPVMQLGPVFGAVAVVMTALTTDLFLLGGRAGWREAAAAAIPSILGYIALTTSHDEGLRGRTVARFEAATLAGLGVGAVAAGPLLERSRALPSSSTPACTASASSSTGTASPGRGRCGGHRRGRGRPMSSAGVRPAASTSRATRRSSRAGHLAAGADLDRAQRDHRGLDDPDDLPAGGESRAGIRGPAADGRVRARAGQHRPGRRVGVFFAGLFRPGASALPADDDHGRRCRRRPASWWRRSGAKPRGDVGSAGRAGLVPDRPAASSCWRERPRGPRHACRHQRGASGRPRRDHGPLLGLPGVGQIVGRVSAGARPSCTGSTGCRSPPPACCWSHSCRCAGCETPSISWACERSPPRAIRRPPDLPNLSGLCRLACSGEAIRRPPR